MKEIDGLTALHLASEVSKISDGTFKIAFYQYSKAKGLAGARLRVIEGCKVRKQLPSELFSIDGDNFFLFLDSEGNPKTAYKVLIRFIGFPNDGFKLRKVKWFKKI